MANNRSIANHVFFENATTTGKSDYLITSNASQMTLKVVSNGIFQLKITADVSPKSEGNLKPYPCYQLPSMTAITDVISDANYLYSIDLTAIDYLRIEIVSLTESLSVYGKAVG